MALNKASIRDLYRKRAAHYDFAARLYYLIGYRDAKYRNMALESLRLNPGDTAVEIGCGTGLNFSQVHDEIGENGQLIGVDLTDAMLEQARSRIEKHAWTNIQLEQSDALEYRFPADIQAVYSTYALTLMPEYDQIIEHAAAALAPGGRMMVLDFKRRDNWPLWLVNLGVWIMKPFGVSLDMAERKPWEVMQKHFSNVDVTELYFGGVYIAVGTK